MTQWLNTGHSNNDHSGKVFCCIRLVVERVPPWQTVASSWICVFSSSMENSHTSGHKTESLENIDKEQSSMVT